MKCPKCGSVELKLENKSQLPLMEAPQVALRCAKCSHWIKWCPKEERHCYIEPTTAEMLLFITKFCIRIEASIFMTKKLISICKPVRGFESLCTEEIFKLENGFEEAIKQAYDWAKQEEQNAKN